MIRWPDERAVTVQIGAVLLLAIVFAALALYQVNAVPAENQAIESEHNQQVQGELQDLRNAGTDGGSESVSVTLGTRYPTRTFLTNPPNPTGSLETGETGTVRIDNADVTGTYTGDPGTVLETDHETRTLRYEPSYNEYRDAPTTRIEHGFAFNAFDDASIALTDQPLIDGERITVVLVEGDLSTTVDTGTVSGPTDPIALESTGDNIEIEVPTASPTAWNEAIGTDFGTDQEKARVTDYAAGQLTTELEDDPNAKYELQMTRISVGDGSVSADGQFDVREGTDDSIRSPAYHVDWEDPSSEPGADGDNCDSESCVVTDDITLTMGTTGVAAGARVDYAVSDPTVGALTDGTGTTADDGTDTTTFEIADGDDGETVTVYTSSGSDSDEIELEISRDEAVDTYALRSVSLSSGGGNDIDVAIDVDATDSGGEMVIISRNGNGVRDRTTVGAVSGTHPVGGGNQATEVEVRLRDSSGTVRDSRTVPWDG
ncbi:hypothetical protein [Natrinema amylolyticum]|uniref:hypothetical protein n=1 Tax=Natrinema amylolyticum TaxID=2878679 RepID=UPI001CFA81E6|nr:hypothetical protein [Natrinema amylolyticum]